MYTGQPDQIIQQINLDTVHFIKQPDNRINFWLVGSEYHYIILKLNVAYTCADQCLSIDNTSLDTVNIYRIYNNGTNRLLYQGGNLVAYIKSRSYVWHTVPVEISKTPSFYLIALKASQKNINVKYEILDKDKLHKKSQGYERLIFFYTDIICIISMLSFVGALYRPSSDTLHPTFLSPI